MTICCGADDADVERRATEAGWKAEDLRRVGACGTPDQVLERLGEWRAVGASVAYLQLLDSRDLDHLELLAAEVLPHA